MTSRHLLLGRYAILQHIIAVQHDERQHTLNDKNDFFAHFARPHFSLTEKSGHNTEILPTETDRLLSLAEGSQDNLFTAKTVFPFVLFADTIKIDRQKITIVHNDFLAHQTVSTEIRNIMNVQGNVGPLFGTLTVTSKHLRNNTITIKFLKRKDVILTQRLLQGFMIARRANIDTDNIEKKKLMALLIGLGQENHT